MLLRIEDWANDILDQLGMPEFSGVVAPIQEKISTFSPEKSIEKITLEGELDVIDIVLKHLRSSRHGCISETPSLGRIHGPRSHYIHRH